MAEGKVMKVRNLRGFPFIVIPNPLAAEAGLKIGDYVWMEAQPGMISIYPIQGFGRHGNSKHRDRETTGT